MLRIGVGPLSFIGVVVVGLFVAAADDEPGTKLNGWQQMFRRHAASFEIVVAGSEDSPVKLGREPILNWSQPVRGGGDGAVFLWVQEGHPVALGTLFIWPTNDDRQAITHEMHSLSRSPLTVTWKNRRWTPPKDALEWKVIPNVPEPEATSESRLRQMRTLSRQFQAESHNTADRMWVLRLLPRPLYRYEIGDRPPLLSKDVELLDGAVFGFVEGTDLEIVLLVEAHRTNEGRQWTYALARMSDLRLRVTLAEKPVWEAEKWDYGPPNQPYNSWTLGSVASPDTEAVIQPLK
jgi:hypothetical protein